MCTNTSDGPCWNECHGDRMHVAMVAQDLVRLQNRHVHFHTHDIPSVHGSGASGLKTDNPKPAGTLPPIAGKLCTVIDTDSIAAMAMQGASGQQGAGGFNGSWGITPTPSPAATPAPMAIGAGPPTGMSPTAKRPLTRQDIAMDVVNGPSQAMSTSDLTQGFYNLMGERERDAKWVHNCPRHQAMALLSSSSNNNNNSNPLDQARRPFLSTRLRA